LSVSLLLPAAPEVFAAGTALISASGMAEKVEALKDTVSTVSLRSF